MDVSQILPNRFVGSCPVSPEEIDRLTEDGITAVLNVQTDEDFAYWGIGWPRLEDQYRNAGVVETRRVRVRDFDPGDLRHQLPRCVEALAELLQRGRTVYLHCNMAINRSPTIAIAYLHWVLGWSLDKATEHVMTCRSCDPYLDAIRQDTT